MLRILISHEFFDMTGTAVLHVDGLSFEDVHAKKIGQLLSVIGGWKDGDFEVNKTAFGS